MSTPPDRQAVQIGPMRFYAWSVAIGVVTAFGAVGFRALIALIHNLMFLGRLSLEYDANRHTPDGPWGPFVILVPVVGAIGVVFLVKNFAPEAKGHGVPEVMDAVYYHGGVVRPIVALIKSLASGLSIGSGGSVGREGPIIQIGASFGSTLGQILRLPGWQRITMIGAGAGAGIAATFNTPIGGVLFAVEIILHEVSARTLVPVTIATVTSAYIGRLVFGTHPAFVIPFEPPDFHPTNPYIVLLFLMLGLILGPVSAVYIRSIYAFEDFFDARIGNEYLRHMLGMGLVGGIMYVLLKTTGHYHVEGVGYATVEDILMGQLSWLLLLIFALKLLTTSLTLGSGASGGVFSPGLFMGATLGGVFGMTARELFPSLPIHPAAFAIAGMAGMIGASTGAAITAVVMIYEMTRDYRIIIPMTITVALSYGIRTLIQPQSIYALKLARRGHYIPAALQANLYPLKRTAEIMDKRFATVSADGTMADFVRAALEHRDVSCFVVVGPSGVVGFLTRALALSPATQGEEHARLGDLADKAFITVTEATPLLDVMSQIRAASASLVLVTGGSANKPAGNMKGVITKNQIADAVIDGMAMFSP